MQLRPSDYYSYLRPSKCDLRLYLRDKGVAEGAPSPYEEVLKRLGKRHEEEYRSTISELVDLSQVSWAERLARTQAEIKRHAMPLYQPAFEANLLMNGITHRVTGVPDFVLFDDDVVVVQDCKIARRVNEEDHPEILRTMELYGWLVEQTTGRPPGRLEVLNGRRELIPVDYVKGQQAKTCLQEIVSIRSLSEPPFHPVGWASCGDCGFNDYCWQAATERHDAASVIGVDKGLARALHDAGVDTYEQLLDAFDELTLAALQRPWGNRTQKVGNRSGSILRHARALVEGREIVIQAPVVPVHPRYIMFDLEGLPPQLDETDKVYLWGLGIYEDGKSDFRPAVSDFGPDGDENGWDAFLEAAAKIFATLGDIPFVHWASYEKTKVQGYIDRYGDPDGIGARVLANLIDLLPVTQRSVVLPLPSYSLKVVEGHVGFQRTQTEYGGDWAMAAYIEAVETNDLARRVELMAQILTYNKEDLDAMWAVMGWLRTRVPTA